MRKLLFAAICITTILSSCTQNTSNDFIISIQIENYGMEDVYLGSRELGINLAQKADKHGLLQDTITLEKDTRLTISLSGKGSTNLYAPKGRQIHIAVDANNFLESIIFEGEGSEMSNYFVHRAKYKDYNAGKERAKLNEKEFKNTLQNIKEELESKLSNLSGIDKKLLEKEKRALHWMYLKELADYERNHAYITNNKEFKVSDTFLDELKDLDYTFAEDYKYSEEYSRLVGLKVGNDARVVMEETGETDRIRAYISAIANLENKEIRNSYAAMLTQRYLTTYHEKEWLYDTFMNLCDDEKLRTSISDLYKSASKFDPGNPSPKFYNYTNYKGGTTSLDDFKGKYVYIDCWATWCGPCKVEIPHLKTIEEKYAQSENLVIISLSLDAKSKEKAWRKMIEDKGMHGIQLLADDAMQSQFAKDYAITGIPRFLLIDPDGNIVSANAPRPSNINALTKLFEECGIGK